VVSAMHVHLVFATTYRPGGVLNNQMLTCCQTPKVAVSARKLRAQFTGKANQASMQGHFWSPCYFAASCGDAPMSIIRQYINQQRRPGYPALNGRAHARPLGQEIHVI